MTTRPQSPRGRSAWHWIASSVGCSDVFPLIRILDLPRGVGDVSLTFRQILYLRRGAGSNSNDESDRIRTFNPLGFGLWIHSSSDNETTQIRTINTRIRIMNPLGLVQWIQSDSIIYSKVRQLNWIPLLLNPTMRRGSVAIQDSFGTQCDAFGIAQKVPRD